MQKYGRTFHLPISLGATSDDKMGATSDDKILTSLEGLSGDDLIVTEKMDGENTTLHPSGTHARSPDSRYHPSRDWVKALAAGISPQLATGERIIGENLFARHSLAYDALPSYFLGFAWIVDGVFRGWDQTIARFAELGITPVPTLYRGPYVANLFEDIAASLDPQKQEGFVVRAAGPFPETEMSARLGKYVRQDHVQSETHWMHAPMIANRLA